MRFVAPRSADNTVQTVSMKPTTQFLSRSLNWDTFGTGFEPAHAPILHPNDTLQVAFLLEECSRDGDHQDGTDDKVVLGQLNIQWRSAMGDRGSLSTAWLTGQRRR